MTWDELKYFIKQQKEIGSEFMDIHNESRNIYICTMVNRIMKINIRAKIKEYILIFKKVIESGILMSS